MSTNVLIISGLVFLTVIFVVVAVASWWGQYSSSRTLDTRLDRLTGQQKTPTLQAAGILREPMYPEDARAAFEKLLPRLPSLTKLFEQADFKMQPSQFWMLTAVLVVGGAAVSDCAAHGIFYDTLVCRRSRYPADRLRVSVAQETF